MLRSQRHQVHHQGAHCRAVVAESLASSCQGILRGSELAFSRRLAQRTLLRAEKDAAYWQRIAAVAGGDQFVCSDGEARVLAPSGDVSVTGLAPLFDSWAPARRTTFRGSCDIVLAPGFGEPGAEEPARRSPRAGGRAGGARKSRRSAETGV